MKSYGSAMSESRAWTACRTAKLRSELNYVTSEDVRDASFLLLMFAYCREYLILRNQQSYISPGYTAKALLSPHSATHPARDQS